MLTRCNNSNSAFYPDYGGRGIRVCDRWKVFDNFIADMGEPEIGMTLDRIDNNGPYSPENCRWATRSIQSRNRRSNTRVCINGQTKTIADWIEHFGISRNTFRSRQRRGWDLAVALSTPPQE